MSIYLYSGFPGHHAASVFSCSIMPGLLAIQVYPWLYPVIRAVTQIRNPYQGEPEHTSDSFRDNGKAKQPFSVSVSLETNYPCQLHKFLKDKIPSFSDSGSTKRVSMKVRF
jgi:hypothetical protein